MKSTLSGVSSLVIVTILGAAIAEPEIEVSPVIAEPETQVMGSPAEMTATRCLICHGNAVTSQGRLAPPFRMVKMHYSSLDEEQFVEAVSAWVQKPDKKKSRMPGAINRFGLMPPFPYPEAELRAIAKYLYQTEFQMPGRGRGGAVQGRGAEASGPGKKAACGAGEKCDGGCDSGGAAACTCGGSCGTAEKNAKPTEAESSAGGSEP